MIAILSAAALAGGYYYADSGIVANGRGCAFVAGADTQFGQYYNPAGLVRIDRPTLNVGLSGVKQGITFARWDPATDTVAEPVRNQGGMFTVPELGFAAPIGDDWTVAVGFTSGFSPAYEFPEDGAQRYTIIDTTIWNFQVGPTIAWRPRPWLAVAVGPQWQALRVDDRLKVTITGEEDPEGDVAVDARTWDRFTPGANVGVLIEPDPHVSVGLMVQPGSTYDAQGTGTLDFSGNAIEGALDAVQWTDDDIALRIQLPWFVRTGVAVRPVPELEIEVDFFYETWSALEDIVVSDIDALCPQGLPDAPCTNEITAANGGITFPVESTISLPAGFHDTWSLRFGAEWRAAEWLELRGGGFYETSALDPDEVSVALVDTPKVMGGAGTTLHLLDDRLLVDGYGSVVSYRDLAIRDSTVRQINVFDDTDEAVVGNGDLASTGLAIGAAVRWQIGEPQRPRNPWDPPVADRHAD